ncbi:Hsp20/alpha crystallin family protein [Pseudodesulfovibrio indicus]|uniref:HSP20 family protein n=1 Tax=Pseudodesulfovibrio indicus TaxID=1716143 RepID=A0A126QQ62_9BACT|nr:Hsp20/alpha crystallin family protein [Pseudodesulfovibrio indicus]AMK11857.1 heat-shock protein Hsp20 [Pseudodesulfovibrio indicus]TDT87119.1 HSP20 family protein [Pseudodesulfovibrio indicus]
MADLKRWSRNEISRMRNDVDRLFDDLCADFDLPVMFCRIAGDLDLSEEGETLVVRLELGNMNPDDVHVTVEERLLTIVAESSESGPGHVSSRSFRKELRLPCAIEVDDAHAEFQDGVLLVKLPKCAPRPGQKIAITRK